MSVAFGQPTALEPKVGAAGHRSSSTHHMKPMGSSADDDGAYGMMGAHMVSFTERDGTRVAFKEHNSK